MYGPRPAARLCNEKMAFVWSRTAMVPLGRAERWPFLPLFEHGVPNLCTCERLRTIAAVFYLSFLLFSVVVVGVSCFQLWEMLRQVKNIDFEVCKFLTQVVHVTASRRLDRWSTTARFETESGNENVAGGSSCLRTHSTWSLCARLRSFNGWVEDLHVHCSATCYCTGQKNWVSHASQTKAHACSRDHSPAPRACGSSRLHRDSDLIGSVDHTHCCMLHTTAQSSVWTRSVWTCWRTTGWGMAMGLNCRKDEKNTTSFHQNATKSRHDTFS